MSPMKNILCISIIISVTFFIRFSKPHEHMHAEGMHVTYGKYFVHAEGMHVCHLWKIFFVHAEGMHVWFI